MGILNVTPDSFYDGGQVKNADAALRQVEKMLNEGATFIDIGAYSSRPGAEHVSESEEKTRLLNVLVPILQEFPDVLISIDTFRSEIAKVGIEAGAAMINDISAGKLDDDMIPTVGHLKVPYIMMHMRGTPQTMQSQTDYDDLLYEVMHYFSERIDLAAEHKIHDIIIDPGFGFAKTLEQNFELMSKLNLLNSMNRPVLAGISRKSMIYKMLDSTSENALNGTSVMNTVALLKGANILRVHDVKEAMECVTLTQQL